ncbi:MAG: hypothetical protein QOH32_4997 [Bradyrhizobium sp.]|jgi:hypothetical protein|nr:hypothetical protein [Bradyrhizobium sp.]
MNQESERKKKVVPVCLFNQFALKKKKRKEKKSKGKRSADKPSLQ